MREQRLHWMREKTIVISRIDAYCSPSSRSSSEYDRPVCLSDTSTHLVAAYKNNDRQTGRSCTRSCAHNINNTSMLHCGSCGWDRQAMCYAQQMTLQCSAADLSELHQTAMQHTQPLCHATCRFPRLPCFGPKQPGCCQLVATYS